MSESANKDDVVRPFLSKHIPAANLERIPNSTYHTYCYRHNPSIKCNKEADQKQMSEIQSSIETLPNSDQKAISNIWSTFSAAPNSQRILILKGLLSQCCFHQLSFLSSELKTLIKIDFIATLPVEVSLKILCYLDCASLCNAAQVSRTWKRLADDDRVWHHLCQQHIDRKCPNCGWGLPLLYMKRARQIQNVKNVIDPKIGCKRSSSPNDIPEPIPTPKKRKTRPWKSVYSERYKVERNWRKGIFKIKKFEGHKDGVLCLQFNHQQLLTGSYDGTVKIWDIKSCKPLKTLVGHERGVKTLVFDDKKIITGSHDSTIKIWNPTTGECISTYRGHTNTITSVDVCGKTIVSGSADKTIKVWNVESRTCHTLRGHTDWVNCVKIDKKSNTIISCGDDCTIRVWSLENNVCLKVFNIENGHLGQVQCALPLNIQDDNIVENPNSEDDENNHRAESSNESTPSLTNIEQISDIENSINLNHKLPTHVLSCGLDNQIKLWEAKSGRCIRTQFGHIEGVWSISADNFRIVSGSHDQLVKIWDLQTGKCIHTFGGQHSASVSCVSLADSRFVAGDESGMVKMYCFDELEEDDKLCATD